jgi:hypothetical protein
VSSVTGCGACSPSLPTTFQSFSYRLTKTDVVPLSCHVASWNSKLTQAFFAVVLADDKIENEVHCRNLDMKRNK